MSALCAEETDIAIRTLGYWLNVGASIGRLNGMVVEWKKHCELTLQIQKMRGLGL